MNVEGLGSALQWLDELISARLEAHFNNSSDAEPVTEFPGIDAPRIFDAILKRTVPGQELALLMLALVPHLRPDYFGKKIAEYLPAGGDFPEFGRLGNGKPFREARSSAGPKAVTRRTVRYNLPTRLSIFKAHVAQPGPRGPE